MTPRIDIEDMTDAQGEAPAQRPRTMTDRLIRAVGPVLDWKYGPRKGGDNDAIFEELLNAYEPVVEASNRADLMRQAFDASEGFATRGAEARWIADVDAGVYDEDMPHPARPSQAGDERVARLVEAAREAEFDLSEWLECRGELIKAGFNMDGTEGLRDRLRAALAAMDTPKGGGDERIHRHLP